MAVAGTRRGVVNRYEAAPENIRAYFNYLPSLLEDPAAGPDAGRRYPLDVSISYLFGLVELAQNNSLYCGVVKQHRVDTGLASRAIDCHPLHREDFRRFYEAIFGKKPKAATFGKLQEAQSIRDRIIHGKRVSEKDKRKAVVDIIEFAERFNEDVYAVAGFRPFGDLRGFKGRGQSLDKSTSRWVLRGIGFDNM